MGFKHQLESIDNWKKKKPFWMKCKRNCAYFYLLAFCIYESWMSKRRLVKTILWIMNEQKETVERCKYLYYFFYTYVCVYIYSLNSILKTKKQRRSNRHTNIVSFVHNLPFSHRRLPSPYLPLSLAWNFPGWKHAGTETFSARHVCSLYNITKYTFTIFNHGDCRLFPTHQFCHSVET